MSSQFPKAERVWSRDFGDLRTGMGNPFGDG